MYRKLLEDLIYYHSTKELRDQFNSNIYPYKPENPILMIGEHHNVFSIRCNVYSYQDTSDIEELFANDVDKNSMQKGSYCIEFSFNKMCRYGRDVELGSNESKFPIEFYFNSIINGISVLKQIKYLLYNDSLILLYKYDDIIRACRLQLLNKIMNCPNPLQLISNAKISSICVKAELSKQMMMGRYNRREALLDTIDSDLRSCVCGPNVLNENNARFYICVSCPSILKIRLMKIFIPLLFLLRQLDLPDDIKNWIKIFLI